MHRLPRDQSDQPRCQSDQPRHRLDQRQLRRPARQPAGSERLSGRGSATAANSEPNTAATVHDEWHGGQHRGWHRAWHGGWHGERGSATAEYAVGVVAAVLVAALLLAWVVNGFFDALLGSVFSQTLRAAGAVFDTAAGTWSLRSLGQEAWSVVRESSGSAWRMLTDATTTVVSTMSMLARHGWQVVAVVGSAAAGAASDALRWAGGPVSQMLP